MEGDAAVFFVQKKWLSSDFSMTQIYVYCRCAVQEGHASVVALLLAKGGSIEDKVDNMIKSF